MRNQKGMTLVEVMIAAGISSILIMGIVTLLASTTQRFAEIKMVSTRDDIHAEVRRILADDQAIFVTRDHPNNTIFKDCFHDFTTGMGNCFAQQEYPFWLYDANGNQISGPANAPVFYDKDGNRCASQSTQCRIRVTTSMRPQGLIDWSTRQLRDLPPWGGLQQELIEIKYSITVLNAAGDSEFRPISGSHVLDTMDWDPL